MFSMKRTTPHTSSRETIPSTGEKIAEKIDLEPAKLKDYGGRFLYYPTQAPTQHIDQFASLQPKNTEEYLQDSRPSMLLNKPIYESEEMVFDPHTKRWKLVPESEMYKYT